MVAEEFILGLEALTRAVRDDSFIDQARKRPGFWKF